jgi:hypothetical protein
MVVFANDHTYEEGGEVCLPMKMTSCKNQGSYYYVHNNSH